LSFYNNIGRIRSYRTSESEDLVTAYSYKLRDKSLTYKLPAYSITTFVINVEERDDASASIENGKSYLVIPRRNTEVALNGSEQDGVTIQNIDLSDQQIWTLVENGAGYSFMNGSGKMLTGNTADGSTRLTVDAEGKSEQVFQITPLDDVYCKISLEGSDNALDLNNEGTSAGTSVLLWDYNAYTTTPTHRQWMLFRLPFDNAIDAIQSVVADDRNSGLVISNEEEGILKMSSSDEACNVRIYGMNGHLVYSTSVNGRMSCVPMLRGMYVLSISSSKGQSVRKVFVK